MRNIGTGEIAMLVALALIVVGPKRLPEIARNLGKAWRTFQSESAKAREMFRDVIDDTAVAAEPGLNGAKPVTTVGPPPDVDPAVRSLEDT